MTENKEPELLATIADDAGFNELVPEEERPTQSPETIGKMREMAREKVAFMLVFGFLALLLSTMIFTGTVDDAIKLIQTISSALSGMVGAVLGYYYGSTGLEKTTMSKAEG